MAAGQGFKTFTTGEVLTAADVNGYLMQGVLVFASAAARDAAITSPQEGQFAFTKDTNGLWYYDGAAWVASGATGDIEGVTAGVGISGGGTSGTVTITNSMATAIDAKGDLVAGTGADAFSRLAVGANDTVLTADSTTATGLKWATPASGGMTLLSTTTMSGTTTTVSSISQAYNQLVITISDNYPASNAGFYFRPNADNTSIYKVLQQQGDSGSPYATASPQWFFNDNAFRINATQKAADSNSFIWIELPNYADTNIHKFARYQSAWTNAGDNKQTTFTHGYMESTSAITSIVFGNDGASTSNGTIRIWGIK